MFVLIPTFASFKAQMQDTTALIIRVNGEAMYPPFSKLFGRIRMTIAQYPLINIIKILKELIPSSLFVMVSYPSIV